MAHAVGTEGVADIYDYTMFGKGGGRGEMRSMRGGGWRSGNIEISLSFRRILKGMSLCCCRGLGVIRGRRQGRRIISM